MNIAAYLRATIIKTQENKLATTIVDAAVHAILDQEVSSR
jgi:hypothetical protein